MSNRLKVRIALTEEVRYCQTVEMSREAYDILLEKLDKGDPLAGECIHGCLNVRDVADSYIGDVDAFYIVEEV